jgi:Helicase HerA, central domain
MKLIIPEKILDQHLVALGKTGAGKSSALRHMAEWLLWKGKRVCIVDPKGDWYGLKWAADGKHEGFPIIGFGDFKEPKGTDIPLNTQAGRDLAKMICGGNRPAMIGFRGWMPGEMTRFWIDFSSTLFNEINGEIYLIIDEVHNFAAKGKIMDVDAGKCLHWTNRLMSEARGLGLICLIASQRPAKVHNDTLTCCETLVAMRVNHPSDREASREWIEGCGDMTKGKEVLNSLAQMARGEAFVWSPEIGYGPERVKFPMFETFDSFAPPQLQKKVNAATWDNVALPEVKERFSRIIEEAKANDPAELKRKLAETERKLRIAEQKEPEVKRSEPEKILVFTKEDEHKVAYALGQVEEVKNFVAHSISGVADDLGTILDKLRGFETSLAGARSRSNVPTTVVMPPRNQTRITSGLVDRPAGDVSTNGDLTGPQKAILKTCLMLEFRQIVPDVRSIAAWLDLHPNGGSYRGNLARLHSDGYLEDFRPTPKTEALNMDFPVGIGAVKNVLTGPQCSIFETLMDGPHTIQSLAAALNLHPNGGSFRGNVARLRTMGLITDGTNIKLTSAALT